MRLKGMVVITRRVMNTSENISIFQLQYNNLRDEQDDSYFTAECEEVTSHFIYQ